MRYYELMFISDPGVEEGSDVIQQKIEGIVGDHEGSITSFEKLGKKRLAYPITKRLYGIYNLVNFQGNATVVDPLETFLRLNSQILRHIILVFTEKTLKLRTETQRIQVEEDERMRRGGRPAHELSDIEKEKISAQMFTPASDLGAHEGDEIAEGEDTADNMTSKDPVDTISEESDSTDTDVSEEIVIDEDKSSAPEGDTITKETAE